MQVAHPHLDRLVQIHRLKVERCTASELDGLVKSGCARLTDAKNAALSLESRFDLAYNAAHALALAALRWHGYRSDARYLVFQVLEHTLAMPAAQWRVLAQAHDKRNLAEYEGKVDVEPQLLEALLRITDEVARNVQALGPLP